MRYKSFQIKNYKAIQSTTISFKKGALILLLGINESGKTTVLKAIESFHYLNDPSQDEQENYFASMQNRSRAGSVSETTIKATIECITPKERAELRKLHIETKLKDLLNNAEITIERYFQYKDAICEHQGYRLYMPDGECYESTATTWMARSIIKKAPRIQYYADFRDQIPERISNKPNTQYYDEEWISVINGLFYHANPNILLDQYFKIADRAAQDTILKRVSRVLNKQFTSGWNKFRDSKTISSVDLIHHHDTNLFSFDITKTDGSTVLKVSEISKGALWYLSFLLKTGFRKKHILSQLGPPLYLIDEPASNLHSTAQTKMLLDFRALARDANVIYTTHSQYLIDKENLTNVYIAKANRQGVTISKYSDFIQKNTQRQFHYQPIVDALVIQPFSLDMPWDRVLIVEGIYDCIGLKLFFELLSLEPDYVIMPGTAASKLSTLISLHIGWSASICVLLDFDEEGLKAQRRYIEQFPTLKRRIITYKFINPGVSKITFEKLISKDPDDRLVLMEVAHGNNVVNNITKKHLQQAVAIISYDPNKKRQLKAQLSPKTLSNFKKVFRKINTTL